MYKKIAETLRLRLRIKAKHHINSPVRYHREPSQSQQPLKKSILNAEKHSFSMTKNGS